MAAITICSDFGAKKKKQSLTLFPLFPHLFPMYTLLYLKWITNKFLLHSTGNSAQCYVTPGWEEGIVRELGMDMYIPLYFKWITNKVLLHSTGNSAQCYVAAWMGGEFGGEWVHVYIG